MIVIEIFINPPMKKTILIATSLLLLTGCSQQKSQPIDITDQLQKLDNTQLSDETVAKITGNEINKYSSKELAVSFDYPSNWEVKEIKPNSTTNKFITICSPKCDILIDLPSRSFEEYEKELKDPIKDGKMSVKENSPTDNKKYTAKEYGQEGGVYYLIKIDKVYVGVQSENYLDQKEREQLDIILNSLSSI